MKLSEGLDDKAFKSCGLRGCGFRMLVSAPGDLLHPRSLHGNLRILQFTEQEVDHFSERLLSGLGSDLGRMLWLTFC